ncbi:MAG: polysaccharide deacetylase family protein [Prolixibacteraceae bacterium]|nr:polysaccharide deacetylase family protein [Prolixibacteraceae bacterium]
MKRLIGILLPTLLTLFISCSKIPLQTEILKWKDGKSACVTLTYDDGSDNQFDLAIPIMDELGFPGTFFINTNIIGGTKNFPTFVGRPIMDILNESKSQPTDSANVLERTSMIRYLCEIQNAPELKDVDMSRIGSSLERGRYEAVFKMVDEICNKLAKTNKTFKVVPAEVPEYHFSWDDLKKFAATGHEFADHTISHPYLSALDEANILYETEACKEDLENNLGFDHTLTVEAPFGIHDDRVMQLLYPRYPFLRNRAPDDFFMEILRSDNTLPGKTDNEYIHWQRGPLSDTPYSQMTAWVDTSLKYDVWLVLVFHGIEGIGWEALPAETIRNYFSYIKEKEDQIWVATYRDAYKYIRERINTKTELSKTGSKISVTLDNNLDKKIYNLPLTLKTLVSGNWVKVQLKQGDKITELKPQTENGESFVIYDAMPGDEPVILTKQ